MSANLLHYAPTRILPYSGNYRDIEMSAFFVRGRGLVSDPSTKLKIALTIINICSGPFCWQKLPAIRYYEPLEFFYPNTGIYE